MAFETHKPSGQPIGQASAPDFFGAQRQLAKLAQDQFKATLEATEALLKSRSPSDMIEIQRSWFVESLERGVEQFRVVTETWRGAASAFTEQAEHAIHAATHAGEDIAQRVGDEAARATREPQGAGGTPRPNPQPGKKAS